MPDPVFAAARTSRPASACGRTAFCTCVEVVKDRDECALSVKGERGNETKGGGEDKEGTYPREGVEDERALVTERISSRRVEEEVEGTVGVFGTERGVGVVLLVVLLLPPLRFMIWQASFFPWFYLAALFSTHGREKEEEEGGKEGRTEDRGRVSWGE